MASGYTIKRSKELTSLSPLSSAQPLLVLNYLSHKVNDLLENRFGANQMNY